jgi:hypothetical protein
MIDRKTSLGVNQSQGQEDMRRHEEQRHHGIIEWKQVELELRGTNQRLETQLMLRGNELSTVIEVVSLVTYCLELLGHWAVLHASLSIPRRGRRKLDTSHMKSPTDVIEGKKEREVKGALHSLRHNQERQPRSLIRWEEGNLMHRDWQDAMGVSIPAPREEHHQESLAATQILEDKKGDCFVELAASVQHFLVPPTPIFTSQTHFMTNGPQQESIATIIDGSTIIPYWEDDAWWGQQSNSWSPPNNCPNDRTNYFPEISTNLPEIASTPGPSNSFTFDFAELPCANPHSDAGAEAVKDSATQQAGNDESRTPEPQKTIPDLINKRCVMVQDRKF